MTARPTRRWYGVAAVAFFAAAAGVLGRRPGLLLASVVGVAFAAYARAAVAPAVSLDVERELSDPEPDPGDTVAVTVRVRNTGDPLLDLRLVDGVPGPLEATEGTPRLGTALRGGKTAEFSYAVEAERGVHEFDPVVAIARDPSGAMEREVAVEEATTLACLPRLSGPSAGIPLRHQTSRYVGGVPAESGGSGVEFYATREYRPGDPMARIDWNQLARTGEPTTVQFREERTAAVVLVIDARPGAYVGGTDHALERSVRAAARLLGGLLDAGHRAGIAAIGVESCWLGPSTGEEHRSRARRLLADHPALSPTPPAESVVVVRRVNELRRRLPADAQAILLTPLLDDYVGVVAGRLEARGTAVSVISPDVTGGATAGQRLAGIERRARIARLRAGGIPVVDWAADEGLDAALAAAREVRR